MKNTLWKKLVGFSLALIVTFQVFGLDQWIAGTIPATQAAFYNTGFINLLDGTKTVNSEATTIDNVFPVAVSGGNIRTYSPSYSGYNRSHDVRGVSSLTGPITVNLNLPAGQYDIDLNVRYGRESGGEANENLTITAGSTNFNVPDQGDYNNFDIYHFSGFNITSPATSIQIAGTGEGEVDFGGLRIVGQSSQVNSNPVLSACNLTSTGTLTNQPSNFTVSTTGGSAPFTYAFDFNDDGAFDAVNATNTAQFTFTTAATYLVRARVTDTAGGFVNCTTTVVISNSGIPTTTPTASPTASVSPTATSTPTATPTASATPTSSTGNRAPVCMGITASNTMTQEGVVITFQAQATDPDLGDVLQYSFNFGDGQSRALSPQRQAAHDYVAPGVYMVSAQVRDSAGLTATCSPTTVTVIRMGGTSTPTASASPTTSATPTATATSTPTASASPTATATPTSTASTPPTATSTPTTPPTAGPNLAPTCTLTTDNTSPYTGIIVTFTIQANDPEGQALTYAVDFGDGSGYISTGPVSSRSYTTTGNRTIRARVSDGVNLSNCNTVQLTVRSNNSAPTCTMSINPVNPSTNDTVTFTINATDPNGDALVYSYIFGDGNNQDSTSSTTTHRYAVASTYSIRGSVRDPGGLVGQCVATGTTNPSITVVVQVPSTPNPSNRAPACTFVLNSTTSTTAADVLFTVTASDPDGDSLNYVYNFGDGNTRTLTSSTTSYRYTAAGSFIATVSVNDGRGMSTNCTNTNTGAVTPPGSTSPTNITVVITTPGTGNRAPVCTFVVSTITGTNSTDIIFTATASDPDNDPITYTYNFGDGNSRDLATNTTTYRYPANGTFSASVSVRDNRGLSTACTNTNGGITTPNPSNPTVTTITISITPGSPANQAPLCQNLNINPGTTLTANTEMTLTITASDPENSPLSYTVRFNDGTADSNGTTNVIRHTYTTPGTYPLRASISDGSRSTNCGEVTFTVNAAVPSTTPPSTSTPTNRAPVCTAIRVPTTAVAGAPVAIAIDATDPDNQALTYLVNFGDNTNQTSGISPVYHTYSGSGSYSISAQVRDTANVTVNCPSSVSLAVSPVPNTAPVCTTTEISANPVTANTAVGFRAVGSDSDNDALTYTFFFGDGESSSNSTGIISHSYRNNGVYISQIQINDGRGGITNCANTEIRVQAPNTSGQVCRALRLVTEARAGQEFTVEFVPEHPENGPFWGAINFNNGYTSQGFNTPQRTGYYSAYGTYRITSALQDRFGNRTDCPDLFVTVR